MTHSDSDTLTIHTQAVDRLTTQVDIAADNRPTSHGANRLLGVEIPCLDFGFVTLVDYMGNDIEIVQSARATSGTSAKKPTDDLHLLRFMFRHRHTSPFEMPAIRLKCRMPIFVARQWIRHRTGTFNEMSLRYSAPLSCYYVPRSADVCYQSDANRQGRSGPLPEDQALIVRELISAHEASSEILYDRLANEFGIAKEIARSVLPVALYTEWIWKTDLHNLLHFLTLRLDPHAQLEMRIYAHAIASIVQAWVPWTWQAFEDYRLNAITFTAAEVAALGRMLHRVLVDPSRPVIAADREGLELKDRELREFEAKLERVVAAGAPRESLPPVV